MAKSPGAIRAANARAAAKAGAKDPATPATSSAPSQAELADLTQAAIAEAGKDKAPSPFELAQAAGAASPAVTGQKKTGKTVTVACKMPRGVILQLSRMMPMRIPIMAGGFQETMVAQKVGDQVRVKGFAVPFGKAPRYSIIGDFALTPGIDAAFWEAWKEQNKHLDMVVNGLIWAHSEALNPEGDVRVPKPTAENLTDIETEEGARKKVRAVA